MTVRLFTPKLIYYKSPEELDLIKLNVMSMTGIHPPQPHPTQPRTYSRARISWDKTKGHATHG